MPTCDTTSFPDFQFICEQARALPPEDWIPLRIPTDCHELVTALAAVVARTKESRQRHAGPPFASFDIRRTELVQIGTAPEFSGRSALLKEFDHYAFTSQEYILASYVATDFASELSHEELSDEVARLRSVANGTEAAATQEVISRHLLRCLLDKQNLVTRFVPHLRSVAEADALWRDRSNILIRHVRRDIARQLAAVGRSYLLPTGEENPAFTSTCRHIVFNIIQRAYWPIPDEMIPDANRIRDEEILIAHLWDRHPLHTFPVAA